jgi:hypothetical protein
MAEPDTTTRSDDDLEAPPPGERVLDDPAARSVTDTTTDDDLEAPPPGERVLDDPVDVSRLQDPEAPPPGGRVLDDLTDIDLEDDPPDGALPSDTDVQAERQRGS